METRSAEGCKSGAYSPLQPCLYYSEFYVFDAYDLVYRKPNRSFFGIQPTASVIHSHRRTWPPALAERGVRRAFLSGRTEDKGKYNHAPASSLRYGLSACARWEYRVCHIPQLVFFKSLALAVVSCYPVVVHDHNVFEVDMRIALLVGVLEELTSGGKAFRREVFQSYRVSLLVQWPLKGRLNRAQPRKNEAGTAANEIGRSRSMVYPSADQRSKIRLR